MGLLIPVAAGLLVLLVALVAIIFHTIGARVRIRRESETPFRGGKLTDKMWSESLSDTFRNTFGGVYSSFMIIATVVAVAITFGYVLGFTDRNITEASCQAIQVEREDRERQEAEAERCQEEKRCIQRNTNFPDIEETPGRYWAAVQNATYDHSCRVEIRPQLEQLTSQQVVGALDFIDMMDGEFGQRYYGNATRGYERPWHYLMIERNRSDDRAALAARLYGNPSTIHLSLREMRIRFLILRVLAETPEDTAQTRAALQHVSTWRVNDHDPNLITIRIMALILLANLGSQAVETAE